MKKVDVFYKIVLFIQIQKEEISIIILAVYRAEALKWLNEF